jgi:PhzF family phenazine biosynthesis protein
MKLKSFQVDAFTEQVFSGNPAVVVMLEEPLPDDVLMKIARESFVPETAFLLKEGDNFSLRWFTPDIEMDLCGHATLASAHVLFNEL